MSLVPSQRVSRRPAAPASLTQTGRSAALCPACGSNRVTSLAMTLTDGTPVQFGSCHECEHRHWSHEGVALEFTDVLARATKPRA